MNIDEQQEKDASWLTFFGVVAGTSPYLAMPVSSRAVCPNTACIYALKENLALISVIRKFSWTVPSAQCISSTKKSGLHDPLRSE